MVSRSLPPPPDAASLRAAALRYVARYAAHSARLRRILLTRLQKAALQHPDWARDTARLNQLRQQIEVIVNEFAAKNYFDDAAYASAKARALHKQGKAQRSVAAKLQAEGFDADAISAAQTEAAEGQDGTVLDRVAALRLCQRKRLGPYRRGTADAATLRKEFATLARAGFSSAIAQEVLRTTLDEDMN